jgi:hypothetical protein
MENRNQNVQVDEQTARSARQLDARARAREAADKVGIGKSQSLFTLVVFSIAASILIAAYVLLLGVFIIHKKHNDTGSEAAFEAARELSDITVEHPSTGPVSICRWRDPASLFLDTGTQKARSIESIKRTYKKIETIAELSGVSALHHLVQKDEKMLRQLELDLRGRLDRAIQSPLQSMPLDSKVISGGSGIAPTSIAPSTAPTSVVAGSATLLPYNTSETVPSGMGAGVNISPNAAGLPLTRLNQSESVTPSKVYNSVARLIANRYGMTDPANLKLTIKLGYDADLFRKDGAQIFIVNPDRFKPAARGQAPNMVQISFLEPGKKEHLNGLPEKQTIACAGILPALETPAPAAFVLTFPQGIPGFASTLQEYLTYKDWYARGLWNQATAGEIPGDGQLAPPVEPLLTEMTAGDALAAEIYHWLKYAGDRTNPQSVVRMFNEPLTVDDASTGSNRSDVHSFGMLDNEINSCLVNDTGSRQYALMYEGKERGQGQAALARALLISGSYEATSHEKPTFPENALPLYINRLGQCSVSGNLSFDTQLIREFFQDLYATNLAARETLTSIKVMQKALQQSLTPLEQKLAVEREELASLIRRRTKTESQQQSIQHRIMVDRVSDLKQIVEADTSQLERIKNLQKFITNARYNASRAQLNTYELNAQKMRYCHEGITRAPAKAGYFLGNKLAFKPVTKALLESDLEELLSAEQLNATSPWLSTNLSLTGSPDEVFPRDNRATAVKTAPPSVVSNPQRNVFQSQSFTSAMFVFDSRSIAEGNQSKEKTLKYVKAFTKYPFANIKLPESELLYYCQTAVKTGTTPRVGWSVLARDFLANRGHLNGENSYWYSNQAFGQASSPALGCEFQIRRPLALIENSLENAYLQNAESGERMPLIPLVTPDML